ncbi:hypothetical protein GGR51DRAFT_555262 [Nemania sp. FL0031]|nr:hypothetical protein GGR51DRAFT_555262 [Nemania sp. FL0031]
MSAHPDHTGPAGNDNSNNASYYNGPVELPADAPSSQAHSAQSQLRPVAVTVGGADSGVTHELAGNQDFFPPPPPGPPPVSSSPSSHEQQHQKQEEPYFPPPPPRPPPPATDYGYGCGQQYYPPPPPGPPPGLTSDVPPPSYSEEFGDGPALDPDAKTHFPPPPVTTAAAAAAAHPPALPPRPVSAGMMFAPPPTSASQGTSSSTGASGSGSGSGSSGGGFGEKLYRWGIKAGAPVNRIAHRLGAEAFWPMTLDLECEKAARILKSFCKDGFYTTAPANKNTANSRPQSPQPPSSSPKPPRRTSPPAPSKVLVKIPPSVLATAKGLAIFTTFRTGLHISGAGGSGVVVARLPDGSWSPPAGFLVHTLGAGLMVGIDVYDCVCVLTTQSAVDAFARRARVSLGGEIAVVAGPIGVGGALEGVLNAGKPHNASTGTGAAAPASPGGGTASHENKPVWSYMKSRGFYAGVQADGTVIIPRVDANADFYGERGITVERILKGQVRENHVDAGGKGKDGGIVMWPEGGRQLIEVLKVIEGKRADEHVLRHLDNAPTPGDLAPPPDGRKA